MAKVGSIITLQSSAHQGSFIHPRKDELSLDPYKDTPLFKIAISLKVGVALNGSADAISLQSVENPRHYIRELNGGCFLDLYENFPWYRKEASWIVTPGLEGKGLSFMSTNSETNYMCHAKGKFIVKKEEKSTIFKKEATWIVKDHQLICEFDSNELIQSPKQMIKQLLIDVTGQLAFLCDDNAFFNYFGFNLADFLNQRRNCALYLHSCADLIIKAASSRDSPSNWGALALIGLSANSVILKDNNVKIRCNEVNRILKSMKDNEGLIFRLIEDLANKVKIISRLLNKFKEIKIKIEHVYNFGYKGQNLCQSVKADQFIDEIINQINSDYFRIAVGFKGQNPSALERTQIAAEKCMAQELYEISGLAILNQGLWYNGGGIRGMSVSEAAENMKKVANQIDEITNHYEHMVKKFTQAGQ